jgi:ubiquinone/menaquinone biosynthesis C-methylase UbiE
VSQLYHIFGSGGSVRWLIYLPVPGDILWHKARPGTPPTKSSSYRGPNLALVILCATPAKLLGMGVPSCLCHSERSEESLWGRWCLDPGIMLLVVILHYVQNDKEEWALLSQPCSCCSTQLVLQASDERGNIQQRGSKIVTDIDTEARVSYKASEMNDDLDKEIERLRGQALWGWDKEARNLGWFGLRDGMSILEVGSGPGFVTEHLLALCPNSHITCVEIDPDLILPAERYLQSKGLAGRYTIVQCDLMKMDLPADTFDFAFARLVFQHLRDPRGAMKEIRRVLKPGGKLAINDIDIGLGEIVEPSNPEADAIETRLHESRSQRGGDPRIGRQLWRLLEATGYENMDLEVVPVHTDKLGIETIFPNEWDPGGFKPALDLGILTENDVETMRQAHIAFHASPDNYALFVSLMVCGQKPTRYMPR